MTPEQFKLVAIAAIERQIAAGSRLTQGDWGKPGEDGCPVACGCALTLTVQDSDPKLARRMTMAGYESRLIAARHLGLSGSQVLGFIAGVDLNEGHGPWHKAGADVAARFGLATQVEP